MPGWKARRRRDKSSLLMGRPYRILRGMGIVIQRLGAESVHEIGFWSKGKSIGVDWQ